MPKKKAKQRKKAKKYRGGREKKTKLWGVDTRPQRKPMDISFDLLIAIARKKLPKFYGSHFTEEMISEIRRYRVSMPDKSFDDGTVRVFNMIPLPPHPVSYIFIEFSGGLFLAALVAYTLKDDILIISLVDKGNGLESIIETIGMNDDVSETSPENVQFILCAMQWISAKATHTYLERMDREGESLPPGDHEPSEFVYVSKSSKTYKYLGGVGRQHNHRYDVRGHVRIVNGRAIWVVAHERGLAHARKVDKIYISKVEMPNA